MKTPEAAGAAAEAEAGSRTGGGQGAEARVMSQDRGGRPEAEFTSAVVDTQIQSRRTGSHA